jgi:endo-1,3-1,4-beta-glycanase ExoK
MQTETTKSPRTNARMDSLEIRRLMSASIQPAFAAKLGLDKLLDPTPTFVDDFNGTALDTGKWQVRQAAKWRESPNSTQFTWTTKDSVRVGNGRLELIAHNNPATGRLESGWIQTSASGENPDNPALLPGSTANFEQSTGYWEARLKFDSISGMWNAFWVHAYKMPQVKDDSAKTNHPEIYGTEMDVVENAATTYGQPTKNTAHTTIHANGYASQHISSSAHTDVKALTGTSASEFHIYGLLWTRTSVSVFVDGRLVMNETDPAKVSKVKHMTILSNEIGAPSSKVLGAGRTTWGNVPSGGYGSLATSHAKLTADYVHVWALKGSAPSTPPPAATPAPVPPAPTPPAPTPAPPRDTATKNLQKEDFRFSTGMVGGKVFADRNHDGWQNPGERGTVGVRVTLLDAELHVLGHTTTGKYGLYHFDGLEQGRTFYVRMGSGSRQTFAQVILRDNSRSRSRALRANLAVKV